MKVLVNKKFLKELTTLPEKERTKIEKFVFKDTANYAMLSKIPNIGKLKGHRNYYKIRFGDYRIGLRYEDDTLIFERILHRKDIYKYYP
jgi:mRNA interferase RelE/StbE